MENIINLDNDIENYYKNIDKPIINNYINDFNLKNLLKLSTVVDLYLFTKKKNKKLANNNFYGGSTKSSEVESPNPESIIGDKSRKIIPPAFNKSECKTKKMDNTLWKLKDKRELLKECEFKRKKMIKEVSSSLNILSKSEKSSKLVNEIKIKNNNILNKVENIDSIIETLETNYPTLSDEFIEVYSN
jgi:hypothetical protein